MRRCVHCVRLAAPSALEAPLHRTAAGAGWAGDRGRHSGPAVGGPEAATVAARAFQLRGHLQLDLPHADPIGCRAASAPRHPTPPP